MAVTQWCCRGGGGRLPDFGSIEVTPNTSAIGLTDRLVGGMVLLADERTGPDRIAWPIAKAWWGRGKGGIRVGARGRAGVGLRGRIHLRPDAIRGDGLTTTKTLSLLGGEKQA